MAWLWTDHTEMEKTIRSASIDRTPVNKPHDESEEAGESLERNVDGERDEEKVKEHGLSMVPNTKSKLEEGVSKQSDDTADNFNDPQLWDEIELALNSDEEDSSEGEDYGEFGMPHSSANGLNWNSLMVVSIITMGGILPTLVIWTMDISINSVDSLALFLILIPVPSFISSILDMFNCSPTAVLEWLQLAICLGTSSMVFWIGGQRRLDKVWFTCQICVFIGASFGVYCTSRSLFQRGQSHINFFSTRAGVLNNANESLEISQGAVHTTFNFIAKTWCRLLNPIQLQVMFIVLLQAVLPFMKGGGDVSNYVDDNEAMLTALVPIFITIGLVMLVFTVSSLTHILPARSLTSSKHMLLCLAVTFLGYVFLSMVGISIALAFPPLARENESKRDPFSSESVIWNSGLFLNCMACMVATMIVLRSVMRRGSELDDLINYFRVRATTDVSTDSRRISIDSSSSVCSSTRELGFGWGSVYEDLWEASWPYHQAAFPCSTVLLAPFIHAAVSAVPLIACYVDVLFLGSEHANDGIKSLLLFDISCCAISMLVFMITFLCELMLPKLILSKCILTASSIFSIGFFCLHMTITLALCSSNGFGVRNIASFTASDDAVNIAWMALACSQSLYYALVGALSLWCIRMSGSSKLAGPIYQLFGCSPAYVKSAASRQAAKAVGWFSFLLLASSPITITLDSMAHFAQGSDFNSRRSSSASSSILSERRVFFSFPLLALCITSILLLLNLYVVLKTRLVGPVALDNLGKETTSNVSSLSSASTPSTGVLPPRWLYTWIQRFTGVCLFISSVVLIWDGAMVHASTSSTDVANDSSRWSPVLQIVSAILRLVGIVLYLQLQQHGLNGAAAVDVKVREAHLARLMADRDPLWASSLSTTESTNSNETVTPTSPTWVPPPTSLGLQEALSLRLLTAGGKLWRKARPGGNGRNRLRIGGKLAEWVRDLNEAGEVIWVPANESSMMVRKRRLQNKSQANEDSSKDIDGNIEMTSNLPSRKVEVPQGGDFSLDGVISEESEEEVDYVGDVVEDEEAERDLHSGAEPEEEAKKESKSTEFNMRVVRKVNHNLVSTGGSGGSRLQWVDGQEMADEGSLSIRGISITNSPPYLVIPSSELASMAHEPFEFKRQWFFEKVRKLKIPWAGGHQEVKVNRNNFLEDSIRIISQFSPKKFYQTWRFQYENEPGIDGGGLAREWWDKIIGVTFAPKSGLFMFSATDNLSYQPNTKYTSYGLSRKREEAYRFVGRLMGKAMLDEQMIGTYLNPPLWKHILGHPICFDDLALVDESLYQTLTWMLSHEGVGDLDVYFAVDEVEEDVKAQDESISSRGAAAEDVESTTLTSSKPKKVVTRELIPGGASILVTDENKRKFVEMRFKDTMLNKPKAAIGALLHGLYEIIPFALLSVFQPNEIELLICGMPKIDVQDWREHTVYVGGYSSSHSVIQSFWKVVDEDLNEVERCKLLQFVTGTSRVPSGGFKYLQGSDGELRQFTIEKLSASSMPRAHTCFNRLDLPAIPVRVDLSKMLKLLLLADVEGFNTA